MGIEPSRRAPLSGRVVEESRECSAALPYGHDPAPSDVARHFVTGDGQVLVGHVVLHVEGDTGGVYDMGVAPSRATPGPRDGADVGRSQGGGTTRLREPDAERDRRRRDSLPERRLASLGRHHVVALPAALTGGQPTVSTSLP